VDLLRKSHEVSRLEAFSDAVFAFSATLLVVSLEVPDTFSALLTELEGFAAFALSFTALVFIWTIHNAFFRRYGLSDKLTVLLNSCLLFVVLFYVYPLKFVAEGIATFTLGIGGNQVLIKSAGEQALLFVLYSGGFVAVFTCVSMMYHHAWKKRDKLGLSIAETFEARFYFRHYLIFVLVGTLSIVAAWLKIGLQSGFPGWIYMLLGPFCYGHAMISHRYKPDDTTGETS